MKNLIYIPFSYMLYLCCKKAYKGTKPEESLIWMKIQESFLSSFIFFSTGADSCFWEFHLSSMILGVFVFFFILIFCESYVSHVYYSEGYIVKVIPCRLYTYTTFTKNTRLSMTIRWRRDVVTTKQNCMCLDNQLVLIRESPLISE